ncbi:MAG TPA: SRPBCC domain-containing protein [Chloroflexia bacterium]|nr:SRPBCC domain-containing protein [Chloroflexia bacterium]
MESSHAAAPPVVQLPSGPDQLILAAEFPALSPVQLFAYWTEPDLVCRWWPQEAHVEPRLGGHYRFSWPQMHWHLRGHYTTFAPGQALAFTWQWDHDPDQPERIVTLGLTPRATGGTRLTLTHGPYTDSADDQDERIAHHLEGWQHFLPKLQEMLPLR